MLKIKCPHCEHTLQIQTPKLGKFKPNCSGCKQAFVLVIDEQAGQFRARTAKPKSAVPEANSISPRVSETFSPVAIPAPASKADASSVVGSANLPDAAANASNDGERTVPFGVSGTAATQVVEVESRSPVPTATGFSFDAVTAEATVEATKDLDSVAATQDKPQAKKTVLAHQPAAAGSSGRKPSEESLEQSQPTLAAAGRLGGYRLLSQLGSGGMGSVFLAKQLSLDRNVALKTIQPRWADNPRAVARFIREAYAAAQLTHHNVAQIYDLGQDRGTNFFSMELVEGGSLDALLSKRGCLAPERAAVLIVQAARGLQFAHDHGMVHRDIKPANLMLTADGIVKICDLGLVKTPDYVESGATNDADRNVLLASARSQVTGMGSTMGTPAYMAPEQAQDAASVDHRADIYALGCTFFALLTGKPPFSEGSALEIITKKATEKIPREPLLLHGVPSELSSILETMTAANPDQRYQTMSECIVDLEAYLARLTPASNALPTSSQADRLEVAGQQMATVGLAQLDRFVPWVFLGSVGLLCLVGGLVSWKVAIAALMMGLFTPVFASLLVGLTGGASPIGNRLRALLLTSGWSDWLLASVAVLMFLLVALLSGLIGSLMVAILIAALIAAGYRFGIVRPLQAQREPALKDAQRLLKELRLGGLPEDKLRSFVAEFSGSNWELLYESLFGYDELREARRSLKEKGLLAGKKRQQPWRDMVVDRLESLVEARRQEDAQKILTDVECKSLVAEGLSPAEAKSQALARAVTLVDVASQVRHLQHEHRPGETPEQKRMRIKAMLTSARSGAVKPSLTRRASSQLLAWLLGGKMRFALGCLMIAGCALWMRQNELFNSQALQQMRTAAADLASTASDLASTAKDKIANETRSVPSATTASETLQSVVAGELPSSVAQIAQTMQATKPLDVPIVGWLFDSSAAGIVGLLIVLSSLISGWRFSLFALPAAAITLLGSHLGMPGLGVSQGAQWLSAAAGCGLLVIGLLFGRSSKD